MPRNARSVCAGCGMSSDSSITHRAKNILLRLFVSARSSKHLQPNDQMCNKCYSKFLVWFKKGRGIYDNLSNDGFSVDHNEDDENEEQVRYGLLFSY